MTDTSNSSEEHRIIALWVHPRSISTAIERLMRERGDLDCLHEPFMYYYYLGLGRRELPHADLEDGRLTAFDDIVSDLRRRRAEKPVFFKDMGYYVVPRIFEQPALATTMDHVILIRDPRKSILSYTRLDPDVSLEEVGFEAQWRLYDWLCKQRAASALPPPPVIRAEAVQADPEGVIGALWRTLGLSPCPHAFHWRPDDVPGDWNTVLDWHRDVLASGGIRPPDQDGEVVTARQWAEAVAARPRLGRLLEHHRPFYEQLAARADSAENPA